MKMEGRQIVCKSLIREGCDTIFGIPGGAILPLYQALPEFPELRHILTRHEQGASHAADAYARVTGKAGVAFATSGPGATNLVTGIATAQMDSVPMVVITGQVSDKVLGSDAFQEVDITGITLPITKHNFLVMDPTEISRVIKEAFHIATTGRPGPVLVDITRNAFLEECEYQENEEIDLPGYSEEPVFEVSSLINQASNLINISKKPVILAGHGISISGAYKELLDLAEKAQIPVITTLLGISCFPEDHILWAGWPGMHGLAHSSLAIDESDLIIALGMRFDDRITGDVKQFAVKAKKIHVEIDPSEINKNITVLHSRSIAENVQVSKNDNLDNLYSGSLNVTNGKVTDQVTIKGKSLVSSAELTAKAFSQGILGQYGGKLVAIALLLFAFSTSITWCYYGDRSTAYIFGEKGVIWYRNFYVLCFILAAVIDTTVVWNIAYVVVALVSIPNLIAMFFLRKEMKLLSDEFEVR